jgi:hypothetical protein
VLSEVFIVSQVADSEVLITSQSSLLVRESEARANSLTVDIKLAAADVVEAALINSCMLEWNSAMLSMESEAEAPSLTNPFK